MAGSSSPVFTEEQRFEPWISALVVVTGVPAPVVLGAVMGVRGVLLGIVLVLAPLAVFVPARLTTDVTDDGLSIRFFPFHRRARHVPFSKIESSSRRAATAWVGRATGGRTRPLAPRESGFDGPAGTCSWEHSVQRN